MGSLISIPGTLFSRGPAGEASKAGDDGELKTSWTKVGKSPTRKRTTKTYADVVKSSMSKLPGSRAESKSRKTHED